MNQCKEKIQIPWTKAKNLLKEGDILLYRGKGIISWLIKWADEGQYSHVGLVTKYNNNGNELIETVEFREWKGGRVINLENEVKKQSGRIDVYRVAPKHVILSFNKKTEQVEPHELEIDFKKVTYNMRKMAGLPYGWKRIWWIAKHKILGLRLMEDLDSITCDKDIVDNTYPVCSTAVATAFSMHGFDLIHNRPDQYTQPSDFAKSTATFYLFTIIWE